MVSANWAWLPATTPPWLQRPGLWPHSSVNGTAFAPLWRLLGQCLGWSKKLGAMGRPRWLTGHPARAPCQ